MHGYAEGQKVAKSAGEAKPLYQMEAEAKAQAAKAQAQTESFIDYYGVQDMLTQMCNCLIQNDRAAAREVQLKLFGLVVLATAAGQVDTHDVAMEARKAFDILDRWPA